MLKRSSIETVNHIATEIARATEGLDLNGKNPAAVALGRRGGLKGGKARAAALTPQKRKEIAIFAAQSRWSREKE